MQLTTVFTVAFDGTCQIQEVGLLEGAYEEAFRRVSENPSGVLASLSKEDVFSASVPVYSVVAGRLKEHLCERVGWPRATHGGTLMMPGRFWATPEEAVICTLTSLSAWIEQARELMQISQSSESVSGIDVIEKELVQVEHEVRLLSSLDVGAITT
jgi:hypothetical protein